jgi:hypothetical protein
VKNRARDRHDPLMTALAVSDEHSAFGDPQVLQPQPEDLAAAQPAEHHRGHHRPIPMGAQRGEQRINLARFEDPRQRPPGADQRHALAWTLPLPPGRQTPRHRIHRDVATGIQIAEQP